ncbi:MAG: polysaccharide deacetylase family protein [Bacteroidales bacterium]|nr:polysaccharide deacetylase family protein [Bacteroidales bacterium]
MDLIVHPPNLVRHFFKNFLWKMTPEEGRKVIYITIDDGPIPELTPQTLKTLAEFGAKATFFCVGENVQRYPDIYQQIINGGHSVGNHTFNHLKGSRSKIDEYVHNMHLADQYIKSSLFRPPHGILRKSQARIINKEKKIVLWDVLTEDYDRRITPEQCWKNVERNTTSGSIIVFHDNIKAEPRQKYALRKTLEYYSQLGYVFDPIPDGVNNF